MNEEFASANPRAEPPRVVAPADSVLAAPPTAPVEAHAPIEHKCRNVGNAKEQEEFLWKVHSYTNEYIRFADTKAAFHVVLATALIGALFTGKSHQLFLTVAPTQWPPLSWICLGAFFFLVASILAAVMAVRPRFWTHSSKGFIFWESIARYETLEAFTAAFQSQRDRDYTAHIAHHLYSLAKVARRKYFFVNIAIIAGTIGGLLAIATLLLQSLKDL